MTEKNKNVETVSESYDDTEIEYTEKTLSRYSNCIMARVYDHKLLETLSEHASVPVINGLSDAFHPYQILADFMTIK